MSSPPGSRGTPGDASTPDAGAIDAGADASSSDAGSPVHDLAARADAISSPAFTPNPTDLTQCVGGAAVIVTPDETVVRGWGATELGGTVAPGADTLFQIGSVTKVFTGLAAARLVEEGTITLDTAPDAMLAADLRDALPSWPTLRALLTHHAGLPAFPDNLVDRDGDGMRDPGIDPRSPASGYGRGDLRASLEGFVAPPEAPYSYSNVGIGIAGIALQDRLALTNYDATLRQLVTDDLAMRDTWGEVAAIPAEALGRLATGHAVRGAERVPGILGQMGVLASAGEIVTTPADMARFLRAVVGLDATALAGAITRATTSLEPGPEGRMMGYAVEVETLEGITLYRKGGNTSSYGAYLIWSTEPAVGVAVLTNCGGFMRVVELAEALHAAARPADTTAP
jgi:CubicO group peptidase (beta-lactamase class C family)